MWLVLPLMADVPVWFATQTRSSGIAALVDERLPDPPDTMATLRRLIGEDQFPRVFDALERSPDVGPPPTVTGIAQPVVDAVVPSTVKVSAVACRRPKDGNGIVIAQYLAATTAHVQAGEETTVVQPTAATEVRAARQCVGKWS